MAERRVLFRDGDNPLYLSGYRDSASHIRGRVENGNYNVLFNKRPDLPEGSLWPVHRCTALRSCSESNMIGHCDPKTLVIIDVPDTVQGDYNVIINWARGRLIKVQVGSLDDGVPNRTDPTKRGFDPR